MHDLMIKISLFNKNTFRQGISLHDNLAVLVRHSQAQQCLQTNSKPFQKLSMEFKIKFYLTV